MVGTEVDAVDFERKEDDLMDDDSTMDDSNVDVVPTPAPKLKSTITGVTSKLRDGDITRPKEGVSEKKSMLNAIATLQIESLSLLTRMVVLTLIDASFPSIFKVLDWVLICPWCKLCP
jgi:hypothetical protein